jgi:hypothetical protein
MCRTTCQTQTLRQRHCSQIVDNRFIQKVICKAFSSVECELCGQHYEAANISFMGHRNGWWFLSLYCSVCKRNRSAVVGVGKGQPTQVIIEPAGADTGELSAPIDFDDVLDMHIFLKDFDGDFRSLFCERQEGVSPPL